MDYIAIVTGYLLIINLITFIAYAMDKNKAKKGSWRIPEKTLLLFTAAGGSVGALIGMYALRHKTKHLKFVLGVPLLFAFHVIILVYLLNI